MEWFRELIRWRDHVEIVLLVLVLYALGVIGFSQVSPEQRHEIELQAGLKQLYLVEQAHYRDEGRYFDPLLPESGFSWPWMDQYEWIYRETDDGFFLFVTADLGGDGKIGVWSIDGQGQRVRRLAE